MIMKKILVNGTEVYQPVSKEEAAECVKNKEKLIFTSEDEEEEFYEKLEQQEEEGDEITEEINDLFLSGKFKEKSPEEIANHISEKIEQKFNSKGIPKEKNRKIAKLINMLPFMEDEDIHELVEGVLKQEDSLKDISITELLPFMSREDCDAIFLKSLEEENYNFKPSSIAPFVSDECLSKVVDLYIEGKFATDDMDDLYPFLSSKDIKRLFKHIMSE